jgi:hypothetical protein
MPVVGGAARLLSSNCLNTSVVSGLINFGRQLVCGSDSIDVAGKRLFTNVIMQVGQPRTFAAERQLGFEG